MVTPPSDSPIYLSKDGNVAGPFTADQIEEMKRSGEYNKYSWTWEAASQNWVPINPPNKPPSPPMGKGAPTAPNASNTAPGSFGGSDEKTSVTRNIDAGSGASSSREATQTQTQRPSLPTSRHGSGATSRPQHPQAQTGTQGHAPSIPGVPAICFNSRSIIAGKLSEISKDGCVFRSDESTRSLPEFQKGGKVRLNVLEEATGKSENLDASIQRLTLFEGHWEFHLTWDRVPVILEHLQ